MMGSESDIYKLEPIPLQYGFAIILLSTILFQVLNKIVASVIQSKTKQEQWQLANLYTSWIHAGVLSLWNMCCLYLYLEEIKQDVIAYHNFNIYAMVAFATGYFISDVIDYSTSIRLLAGWDVLLHHAGVITIFLYNIILCRYLPYSAIALIVEINSFTLHARKLIRKQEFALDSWTYRSAVWINLATFVTCRYGPLFAISYGLIWLRHRMSFTYHTVLSIIMLLMFIINTVLLKRLVHNDIIRFYSVPKKKHQNGNVKTNNNNNNHLMPEQKSDNNANIAQKKYSHNSSMS